MKRRPVWLVAVAVAAAAIALPACRHAAPPAAPAVVSASAPPRAAVPPASALAPVPVLREYVFRPGPTALLVARMDAAWDDVSTYHGGTLSKITFVRRPLSADGAGPPLARARLLLWPLLPLPDERLLTDRAAVADLIKMMAAELKGRTEETRLESVELRLGDSRLVYFTATDKHPGPGELLYATKGVLFVNELPFMLTILHEQVPVRDDVFAALARWSGFGAANVVAAPAGEPDRARLGERCRVGDGLVCGLLYELSDEAQRRASGLAWLTVGCDAGSGFACGSLGSLYAEGTGVAADEARATKILLRGCDAHGSLACLNAVKVRSRKALKSAPLDPAGWKLVARACGYGGNRDDVCRMAPVEPEPRDAYVRAQEQACARGDGFACRLHGWAFETGYGVAVDVAAARVAYRKACAGGDLWGCFRHALMTAGAAEQARLFTSACEQGSGPACYALAQARYGQPAESRRALLRRACDSSIAEACPAVIAELMR